MAKRLRSTDLVFLDPPYSNVQYSRFYHVLESVARGWCGAVDGVGRYPPRTERPQSSYSRPSESANAIRQLLGTIARSEAKVILTFPATGTNGLSAVSIREEAEARFEISWHKVTGRFSTLGGNGRHRPARLASAEFVMILRPR